MTDTKVNLYRMESLGYIPNDNPRIGRNNANIGEMLLYFKENLADVDLFLHGENREPIVMKEGDVLHEFVNVPTKILERTLADAYWWHLTDMETIVVKPEEIYAKIRKPSELSSKTSIEVAARALLEEKLREHKKEFGAFRKDNGNLAVFLLYHTPIITEIQTQNYSDLMSTFHGKKITKDDIW